MSVTDPIADMLTIVRNGTRALKPHVDVPASKIKEQILMKLKECGFIENYNLIEAKPQGVLRVYLKYAPDGQSVIEGIRRISKSGLRKYTSAAKVPRVKGGIGVAILTTSKGVMTDEESREKNVGGEVLCHVW